MEETVITLRKELSGLIEEHNHNSYRSLLIK
jgi:hypothetical protein